MSDKVLRPRGRRQYFAACLLILSLFAANFAQTATPAKSAITADEKKFAENIKVAAIKDITASLAAPEMQGRGTMQPGGDKAANWLAARMAKLGLKPLGDDGTYLQKIKFKEIYAEPETSVRIGDESLKVGEDYYLLPFSAGNKNVSADVVYLGYALVSEDLKRDDLAGVDVKGKIVMVMPGVPAALENDPIKKSRSPYAIMQRVVQMGAAGVILLKTGREKNGFAESAKYFTRRSVSLEDAQGYPAFEPPFLTLSDRAAEKLFAGSATTFTEARARAETSEFKPIELKQKASLDIRFKKNSGTGSNVVGWMEGSDPKLKDEAIVFSAHYDAYGLENGKIYPGAADNALGVAEMLSVAEAFSKAKTKPKRSLIFLAVTGEEYGLYGSRYWSRHPTWDITKVAADLNLDGIGSEVYGPVKTIVGFGAEHSTLGPVMEDIARAMDINVIPDPVPDEGAFYRSDHYSFVERGVPALMLLGAPAGEKEVWMNRVAEFEKTNYHEPGDTIKPDWNWDGARTVAVIMGIMGQRIAAADKMPVWLSSSRFAKMERGNTKDVP